MPQEKGHATTPCAQLYTTNHFSGYKINLLLKYDKDIREKLKGGLVYCYSELHNV